MGDVWASGERLLGRLDRAARRVERTSDSVARARGAVEGHEGVADEARYRRKDRGDRAHLRSLKSSDALDEYRDQRNGGDDQYDNRGRDDRDPRGQFLASNNATQPRFGGQQYSNGQASGGQSQQQGMSPEEATERFVFAMEAAARAPAGSPARTEALTDAKAILDNKANGLRAADGSLQFPEIDIYFDRSRTAGISFKGSVSRQADAAAAITKVASSLNEMSRGSISDAEIAAVIGAGTTIPQGQPAPQPPAAGAQPPQTQQGGAPAPSGDDATKDTPKPAAGAQSSSQDELNKKAQVALERLGLSTGGKNHNAFNNNNSSQHPEELMDGIVGPKTKEALKSLGIDPTKPITAETIAAIEAATKAKSAPAPAVAAVAGGSPENVAALTASAADASNVAPLAAPPSIETYTPVAGVSATAMGTLPTAEAKPVAAPAPAATEDKLAAGVEALKALDVNKDGVIQTAEIPQLIPVDAAGKPLKAGPEYMAYNERSSALAEAINLSGGEPAKGGIGVTASGEDVNTVFAAAEKSGLKFEAGAKVEASALFASIIFPSSSSQQAEAPAKPVAQQQPVRMPPPISSELAGAPEGGFSPGRTPAGNPALLASASTGQGRAGY